MCEVSGPNALLLPSDGGATLTVCVEPLRTYPLTAIDKKVFKVLGGDLWTRTRTPPRSKWQATSFAVIDLVNAARLTNSLSLAARFWRNINLRAPRMPPAWSIPIRVHGYLFQGVPNLAFHVHRRA